MSGTAALAARREKEARREEWQRRLITWGRDQRAGRMDLPDLQRKGPAPDWYAPLLAALASLPLEHTAALQQVYIDGEYELPHKRALAAFLAIVDKG